MGIWPVDLRIKAYSANSSFYWLLFVTLSTLLADD